MKEKIKKVVLLVAIILSILGIILTINRATETNLVNENIQDDLKIPMKEAPDNQLEQPNFHEEIPNDKRGGNNNFPDNNKPDMMDEQPNSPFNQEQLSNIELKLSHKIIIITLSSIISLSLIYLMMSFKSSKFYTNNDKLLIYILSNIILITIISVGIIKVTENKIVLNKQNNITSSTKDEVTLNKDNIVNDSNINLNKQNSDITITKGGTYTLSGNFNHSVIVDAENEEVKLILNNVEIENTNTAAIIGLSAKKIIINLEDESKNTLTDGGNSEYDGCIWSQSELVFEGTGTLIVNGKQNEGEGIATEAKDITFNSGEYIITSNDDGINAGGDGATITINDGTFYIDASGDGIDSNKDAIINGGTIFVMGSDIGGDAGIDTDDGFTINGGTIIALGSDMIETPLNTSKQNTLAFTLDNVIEKDTTVTLMKDNKEIISFQANKSFKTIIISDKKLDNGTYSLYTNVSHTGNLVNGIYENGQYTKGDKLTIDNRDTFSITQTINIFGSSRRN